MPLAHMTTSYGVQDAVDGYGDALGNTMRGLVQFYRPGLDDAGVVGTGLNGG